MTLKCGLVGDSQNNSRVAGEMAASNCSKSPVGTMRRDDAEAAELVLAELAGPLVEFVEHHQFVAGAELCQQQPRHGRHAGRIQDGRLGPFENGQLALDGLSGRVAVAGVFLAGLLLDDEVQAGPGVSEKA